MLQASSQPDSPAERRLRTLLRDLMLIPGLSGYEGRVRRYLAAALAELGLPSRSDRLGNLIATMEGDAARPSVMLFAHMDQLGLIVRKIEANGLVRVERLGGVPEKALPSQSVLFCIGEGKDRPGLIANKSHHATAPDEKYRVLPYPDLYIDGGFSSAEAVRAAGIDVGTPVVYEPKFLELAGDRVAGTSVDDRAACAVMIEVARALRGSGERPTSPSRLLGAGGVQPARRGYRGPGALARHRNPARSHPGHRHARHDGAAPNVGSAAGRR
jgi:putative aminopeptidase FrvX